LRQSSSAGARIDLSSLWILSSHEARTDPNQCPPGLSMAFSRRPSLPYHKYNGLCHHQNFCLVAADATQIAFPTVLMFFLVTQFHVSVRNCEDEPHLE
ncbi:hypothetical protein T02_11451, partial [Trichinella nativa]